MLGRRHIPDGFISNFVAGPTTDSSQFTLFTNNTKPYNYGIRNARPDGPEVDGQ